MSIFQILCQIRLPSTVLRLHGRGCWGLYYVYNHEIYIRHPRSNPPTLPHCLSSSSSSPSSLMDPFVVPIQPLADTTSPKPPTLHIAMNPTRSCAAPDYGFFILVHMKKLEGSAFPIAWCSQGPVASWTAGAMVLIGMQKSQYGNHIISNIALKGTLVALNPKKQKPTLGPEYIEGNQNLEGRTNPLPFAIICLVFSPSWPPASTCYLCFVW